MYSTYHRDLIYAMLRSFDVAYQKGEAEVQYSGAVKFHNPFIFHIYNDAYEALNQRRPRVARHIIETIRTTYREI